MSAPATNRIPVLFVDDNPWFLEMIARALRDWSHEEWEVLTASDLGSALVLLEQRPVHLLVLNVQMPGVDAPQLLIRLQTTHPAIIKVGLCTAMDATLETACLQQGMKSMLLKPRGSEE